MVGAGSCAGAPVSDEVVASAERGEEKAVLAWLEGGGRVNATYERDGLSGLAAGYGHERVVELLLQNGADVNLQNSNGGTALMIVALLNHPAVVQRLLRAGADAARWAV